MGFSRALQPAEMKQPQLRCFRLSALTGFSSFRKRCEMPVRTARVAWQGTLQEGSGKVELTSSKVGTYDVNFPKRAADDADGTTSPEELIAAAHAACYAMSLSNEVGKAGGTPQALDVTADVTLGRDDSGLAITGITLTVRGEVDGLDADGF